MGSVAYPARATGDSEDAAAAISVYVTAGAAAVGGLAMSGHLIFKLAVRRRPTTAAIVTGHVFGSLNTAFGAMFLTMFAPGVVFGGEEPNFLLGVPGLAQTTLGGLTTGLTIGATLAPEDISVAPLLVRDVRGGLVPGLSVGVGRF